MSLFFGTAFSLFFESARRCIYPFLLIDLVEIVVALLVPTFFGSS